MSVVNQSYAAIEYIIIDGASSDGTMEKVHQYSDRIDTIVSEKDSGIYQAMNKGLDMANGDWIAFMNAGDRYFNNHAIEHLVKAGKKSDGIVFGKSLTTFGAHQKLRFSDFGRGDDKWYNTRMPNHQAILVPKHLYKAYKFDTSYKVFADTDYLRRVFESGTRVFETDEVISVFHLGGKSNYYAKWSDFKNILKDTKRLRSNSGIRQHVIKFLLQSIFPKKVYLNFYLKHLVR